MNIQSQGPDLNVVISHVLRWGVILSAVLISVGVFLLLVKAPAGLPSSVSGIVSANYGKPTLDPSVLYSGVAEGNPVFIIQLGLIVLLATPMARVAASVVLFVLEKDAIYVAITLFVLMMLLLSIFAFGPILASSG